VSGPGDEWYADGLRFTCTCCGNCCTGPPGYVWLTDAEAARIAAHLGLDESDFRQRCTRRIEGRLSLVERATDHGHDCVFLDRDSVPGKAVCSVYAERPLQCRTWPFWPENLRTRRSWQSVRRATPCPGMDQGRLVPAEEIRITRDRQAASEGGAGAASRG
jgi:hypothetical protein